MKLVDVFHFDGWESGYTNCDEPPPEKASEFQVWINKILDSIPREFFDSATVDISGSGGDYGSSYFEMRISYYRPETAEEIAEEKAKEQARIDRSRKDELDTYLRLKNKFEGEGGVK